MCFNLQGFFRPCFFFKYCQSFIMEDKIVFREATIDDIKRIQVVRHLVKENVLSNPALVTDEDCREYIMERGKGWVCEVDETIVGFAIADLKENSIWALFLQPGFEGKGIGKKLLEIMLDWYFAVTKEKVWLTTTPGTRAEAFYKKAGWKETERKKNGDIKFEITFDEWRGNGQKTIGNKQ